MVKFKMFLTESATVTMDTHDNVHSNSVDTRVDIITASRDFVHIIRLRLHYVNFTFRKCSDTTRQSGAHV